MTLVQNFLEPAVELLATRMPGVQISGPRDDLPVQDSSGTGLPLTIIVQAAGGPNPQQPPMRQSLYTCQCYADDPDDALALYGGVLAALTDTEGYGITNVLVNGRWWLYEAAVGGATGPTPDPEAGWPMVVAPLTMTWSMLEVG